MRLRVQQRQWDVLVLMLLAVMAALAFALGVPSVKESLRPLFTLCAAPLVAGAGLSGIWLNWSRHREAPPPIVITCVTVVLCIGVIVWALSKLLPPLLLAVVVFGPPLVIQALVVGLKAWNLNRGNFEDKE